MATQTKITGHRGYPTVAPENTLPSFRAAIAEGAERIEFDLHPSRDGHLVVHHDYYLGRTNDGDGPIHEQEWGSLSRLDAGAWFSPDFKGVRLCRLADVLDAFGFAVEYEIELKWPDAAFVNAVIDTVQERDLLRQTEFTAPHLVTLQALRERCPEARRGIFLPSYPDWMEQTIGKALSVGLATLGGFPVAHCPEEILTASLVASLHQAGVTVHAANCDDSDSLDMAFRLGVDYLSTNAVKLAVEIRAEGTRLPLEK